MKILVTGVAGFIGFSFCKKVLTEKKDTIIGIDNLNRYYNPLLKEKRLDILKNQSDETIGNFKFYKMDLEDHDALDTLFSEEKPDIVLHLAAQAGVRFSIENPQVYEHSNNLGTLNIFELAKKYGIKKVVYASSSSVYGGNEKIPFSETDNVDKPVSVYAATKKYNEVLAHVYHHLYGIEMIGLRFFTVYGEFGRPDMAYWKFTKKIVNGEQIDVYNFGDMKRDFTYIDDIIEGITSALNTPNLGYNIFNLGGDNPVNLEYLISLIEKELGKTALKNYLPIQAGDVPVTMADLGKSKKILHYYPKTTIDVGIHKFVKWYLENKDWLKRI